MNRRWPPAVDTDCSRPFRAHSRMVTGDTMSKPAASKDVAYFLGLGGMFTPAMCQHSHIVYIESIVSCVFGYRLDPRGGGCRARARRLRIRTVVDNGTLPDAVHRTENRWCAHSRRIARRERRHRDA